MQSSLLDARIDGYTEHLRFARNASPHTVRSYAADLSQFVNWLHAQQLVGAGDDWGGITYLMIRRYLGHLSAQNYDRHSVVRKLSSLKSFYKWLEREGLVTQNVAAQVLAPRAPRELPDVLELSEVEAMLSLPARDTPFGIRDRALLETLYATGVRVAEAANLDLGDVDWHGARNDAGEMRVREGKRSKDRVVLLGRHANEALLAYVHGARPELMARCKNQLNPVNEALWINGRGTRLSAHAIYMLVLDYAAKAGIQKRVTPHTLRHSFATHLQNNGMNLRDLQELLGHQSLSSTQIYTRVGIAHLQSVYDRAHPRAHESD